MRWVVILASLVFACGASRLPAPSYVGQPTEALEEVDYPPPPARIEYVPTSPREDAVWIDGEWIWHGPRWAWKTGRWVIPPPSARFSPWTSVRDSRGTLYVAEGKWRDQQGQELPDPDALAVGRPRGGVVVNPEGEEVPAAPHVQPQTASDAGSEDAISPRMTEP